MRDRLIELFGKDYMFAEDIADTILADGWIRPPAKFGDTIYVIPSKTNIKLNTINGFSHLNRVYEQKISKIEIYANNKYLLTTCDGLQSVHCDLYQETWFLTREEAEAKLKEGGKGEF